MSSAEKAPDAPPRRRAARSLAFRLNAWYAAVFVLSLAALAALAVPQGLDAFHSADHFVLETRVERHMAVLSGGLEDYQRAVEGSAALGGEPAVRVRDGEGRTLFQHGDLAAARFTAVRESGQLLLEVGDAPGPWKLALERLKPVALVLTLGALALALAGGVALTRRGLLPVRELAATAREVTRSGDLTRRVPERGSGDELDELSQLFNRMLARNQALVGGMREALDNVAHDLRTPLTRLRGTAEVALRDETSAGSREALAVCIEESDRVLTMLRTLMDISEAETGLMRLERTPVGLGKLAGEVAELYGHVAEEAGLSVSVSRDESVTVLADANRLRQAIANVVDNAIKYTPRGGRVSIDVAREASLAIVRVSDTGEGIPEEAMPRIFDRLYRAEPSRSKPGLGLGLSLVKAIVTAHGGSVHVDSVRGKGSVVTLSLPSAAGDPVPA